MKQRTTYTGLTDRQVAASRARHGANVLTPPPQPSLWSQFREKFRDPLIRILLVALLLSVAISVWNICDGAGARALMEPLGIFVAVILATAVGFVVEVKANRRFKELNQINDDVGVKVVRNGKVAVVTRRDIVVGDIVMVESGDEIPADGEILKTAFLTVDESSLTGEPLTNKSMRPDHGSDSTYPRNMLYRGTSVAEGNATMRVTAVGDSSEAGNVFKASQIDSGVETPLTLQLRRLGKVIAQFAYLAAILIFVGRTILFINSDIPLLSIECLDFFLRTAMIAVTLIVVSVPEGLPMSINLSLALSMNRMLRNNNLVRKLHACETLGATTVICTDKTGTLTRNRMTVNSIDIFDPELRGVLAENIAVNSTAHLRFDDNNSPASLGNPTEGALLLWLDSEGIDYADIRHDASVESVIPFSGERKFMATVVADPTTLRRRLLVKGAPAVVMKMSSGIAGGLTADDVARRLLAYQQQAMRTIAFAYAEIDEDAPSPIDRRQITADNLTLIAIAAISDPVRDDVPEAILRCKDAGIDVKIVTGDATATAIEIGKQTGVITDDDILDEVAIDGPSFAALTDDAALDRIKRIKVLSRARPSDKLRLVKLLQQCDEVVAVTGDGTNDAPALKAAQVGLSMGDGTSVAKEASDITIIDNSFASIVQAVKWGRSLYLNIQRFLIFQLVVNVAACCVVAWGSFTGFDSPLTVTQMLWVNLIMDTFAALALSSLPPSEAVLERPPRRQSDAIITRPMRWFVASYGLFIVGLFIALAQYFHHPHVDGFSDFSIPAFIKNIFSFPNEQEFSIHEYSLFFSMFVFCQFWNMFNARSFDGGIRLFSRNRDCPTFLSVALLIAVGQVAIVTFGGQMFNVAPLTPREWLFIVGGTSAIAIIPQAVMSFCRRKARKRPRNSP